MTQMDPGYEAKLMEGLKANGDLAKYFQRTRVLTWKHLTGPTAESVADQLKALEPGWTIEDADGLQIRMFKEVPGWAAEVYRDVLPGEVPVRCDDSFHEAIEAIRSRQQRANE